MTGRWAPSWFGQGLLTRPSSATAVPDRRRVTWSPSVGRTAGSADPRRTKGRTAGSGDPRRTEPEVPSAKSVIAISNVIVDQGAGSVRTSSPALDPVAILRIPRERDQVLGQLERRPRPALRLEGVVGLTELLAQLVSREQLLIGAEAPGGEALVPLQEDVSVAKDIEVTPVPRHLIGGPRSTQGVDMTVGVVRSIAITIRSGSEDVAAPSVDVPVVPVLPDLRELPVLRLSGCEQGSIEVLDRPVCNPVEANQGFPVPAIGVGVEKAPEHLVIDVAWGVGAAFPTGSAPPKVTREGKMRARRWMGSFEVAA